MKILKILKAVFNPAKPDIPIYCKKCGKHYADKYKDSRPVKSDDGLCFSCFKSKSNN